MWLSHIVHFFSLSKNNHVHIIICEILPSVQYFDMNQTLWYEHSVMWHNHYWLRLIKLQNMCNKRFQDGAMSSCNVKTALIRMLTHWCDTGVSIQKCCCPHTNPNALCYVQKQSWKPWASTSPDKTRLPWTAQSLTQHAMPFRFLSAVTVKHLNNNSCPSHASLSALILPTERMFSNIVLSCV